MAIRTSDGRQVTGVQGSTPADDASQSPEQIAYRQALRKREAEMEAQYGPNWRSMRTPDGSSNLGAVAENQARADSGTGNGGIGGAFEPGGIVRNVTDSIGLTTPGESEEQKRAREAALGELNPDSWLPSEEDLVAGYVDPRDAFIELDPSQTAQTYGDSQEIGGKQRQNEKGLEGLLGQYQGLGQDFADIYNQGGMTEADRAKLQQGQFSNAQKWRGQREGVMQDFAARGLSGSNSELLAALQGGQDFANANAMENAAIQQSSQARMMDALYGQGDMLGQQANVRGQMGDMMSDRRASAFDEDFTRRSAADAFAENNTRERRRLQMDYENLENQRRQDQVGARKYIGETKERAAYGRSNLHAGHAADAGARSSEQRERFTRTGEHVANAVIGVPPTPSQPKGRPRMGGGA